jgi:hypothetical protein
MSKKVINNPKKEENTMNNSKATSNVLLSLIALILGVIAFNAATASKAQKRAMQGLSTLVGRLHSNVMAINLTNEGRRVASAHLLAKQVFGSNRSLINHGVAGIDAYLTLHGDEDIVSGAKSFTDSSKVYFFQTALTSILGGVPYNIPVRSNEITGYGKTLTEKTYSPEAEKIVPQLEAAGISGESMEFGKALAIKTYSPAAERIVSLVKEGKQKTGAFNEIK